MQDVKIKVDMIKSNQTIYRRNNNTHDTLRNWENYISYVDPILWNWCILDGCRGITVSMSERIIISYEFLKVLKLLKLIIFSFIFFYRNLDCYIIEHIYDNHLRFIITF